MRRDGHAHDSTTLYRLNTASRPLKAAEGRCSEVVRLPPSRKTTITLPMTVSAKVIDKVNDKLQAQKRDTVTYRFADTVYTDLPIAGERKFGIDIDQQLPVVWLPKLKPGDLDIKKFGFKHTGINMTVPVTNPNSFAIRMKDGRYSMTVDGNHTASGNMPDVVKLPPKATVPVTTHMDMELGRALKRGWKALFDRKNTKYSMVFDGRILSNQKPLQNSAMHFRDEGTPDKLMKALAKQGKCSVNGWCDGALHGSFHLMQTFASKSAQRKIKDRLPLKHVSPGLPCRAKCLRL